VPSKAENMGENGGDAIRTAGIHALFHERCVIRPRGACRVATVGTCVSTQNNLLGALESAMSIKGKRS
jgi:hypothetical protein